MPAWLPGLTKFHDCVLSNISQRLNVYGHVYFSSAKIESKSEGLLLLRSVNVKGTKSEGGSIKAHMATSFWFL